MKKKEKKFGKHVIAFHGRQNSKPLSPLISVAIGDDNDDACFGDWLSLREAENLAKQILKAVAYLRD